MDMDVKHLEREFHGLIGALDAISALKGELELRREKAFQVNVYKGNN